MGDATLLQRAFRMKRVYKPRTPEQRKRAAQIMRALRAANPDKYRKYGYRKKSPEQKAHDAEWKREDRKRNLEKRRAYDKQRRLANLEKAREIDRRSNLKRLYGLSYEEGMRLYAMGCEVCGEKKGRMCIDHCHTTNRVRGVLCVHCNFALGYMREKPELIDRLKFYAIHKCQPLKESP